MRKQDIIVGKWYTSTSWVDTLAIKIVENKKEKICVYSSQEILKSGTFIEIDNAWTTFRNFKEIPISEIAQYLPKDHPDLKEIVPEYVECIELPNTTNLHLYSATTIGKIYKVAKWMYTLQDCLLVGETKGACDRKRFKVSTKEAYDAQNKGVQYQYPEETVISKKELNSVKSSKSKIKISNIFVELSYTSIKSGIGKIKL